jgi:hypothetical protein
MRTNRLVWLTLLGAAALVGMVLVGLRHWPVDGSAGATPAEWTVLLYLDADCDLEESVLAQLESIVAAGSSRDVNIVVLCDRSPLGAADKDGYSNEGVANMPNWSGGKLFYVRRRQLVELADWGDVNMGDPALLTRFVRAATERYPARKYALIFSDHGLAWSGLCNDDSHNGDWLTLPKLGQALKDITRTTGKLEVIGFDCCLMANLETAHTVAPYARLMVASEEVEPGCGWDYASFLNDLHDDPRMDGGELGRHICDSYYSQFAKSADPDAQAEGLGVTLSVIDLAQIGEVEAAVNRLADCNAQLIAAEQRKGWLKLARARGRTEEYGRGNDTDDALCYDLLHLAQRLRRQNPAAAPACHDVETALQSAVLHRVAGTGLPHASGLSIFFPRSGAELDGDAESKYEHLDFARQGTWFGFLRRYTHLTDSELNGPTVLDVRISQNELTTGGKETATVTAKLSNSGFDRVYFTLAQKRGANRVIIGQVDTGAEGVDLHKQWDGGWFMIGTAEKRLICPIVGTQEVEGKAATVLAEVPAQIRRKDRRDWIDATLHFYLTLGKADVRGKLLYVFAHHDKGRRQIKLDAGDAVRPRYLQIDEQGNKTWLASERKQDILILRKPRELTVAYAPVDRGAYLVGFAVSNFAGNRDEEEVEVLVK